MAQFTKLALAFIEEWQALTVDERKPVLELLNDKRHEFTKTTVAQRNAYATAAYILAALEIEPSLPVLPSEHEDS